MNLWSYFIFFCTVRAPSPDIFLYVNCKSSIAQCKRDNLLALLNTYTFFKSMLYKPEISRNTKNVTTCNNHEQIEHIQQGRCSFVEWMNRIHQESVNLISSSVKKYLHGYSFLEIELRNLNCIFDSLRRESVFNLFVSNSWKIIPDLKEVRNFFLPAP
jgi:hypothetical protein